MVVEVLTNLSTVIFVQLQILPLHGVNILVALIEAFHPDMMASLSGITGGGILDTVHMAIRFTLDLRQFPPLPLSLPLLPLLLMPVW
jgi:hypothetical protein